MYGIEVLLFAFQFPRLRADKFTGNMVLLLKYHKAYMSITGVSIRSIVSLGPRQTQYRWKNLFLSVCSAYSSSLIRGKAPLFINFVVVQAVSIRLLQSCSTGSNERADIGHGCWYL